MKRKLSALAALCFALVFALMPGSAIAASEKNSSNGRQHCVKETVPVTLSAADPTKYNVVGWLCANGQFAGKPVQVLVSGFTYDHTYWDFPYHQSQYSYVAHANQTGFATFNIDRIGVGQSDKPAADKVTLQSEAYVTRQIVQGLRNGQIARTHFHKVIGVGHSMGAAIWMIEGALENPGVDGLILADYTHAANVPFIISIGQYRHPAQDDPKFAAAGLPDGYITSTPGSRALQFYNEQFASPQVIAKDEQLKATATSGEAATITEARNPIYTQAITVPVLIVVGEHDNLDCDEATPGLSCASNNALLEREKPFFPNASKVDAFVLPHAGHDTNLHYNAKAWFAKANHWSRQQLR